MRRGNTPFLPTLIGGPFFNNFQGAALAFFCAAHLQQGANRLNRGALTPDDFPDVRRMESELENGQSLALDGGDPDRVRTVDKALHDPLKKGLHGLRRGWSCGG